MDLGRGTLFSSRVEAFDLVGDALRFRLECLECRVRCDLRVSRHVIPPKPEPREEIEGLAALFALLRRSPREIEELWRLWRRERDEWREFHGAVADRLLWNARRGGCRHMTSRPLGDGCEPRPERVLWTTTKADPTWHVEEPMGVFSDSAVMRCGERIPFGELELATFEPKPGERCAGCEAEPTRGIEE